MLTDEQLAAWAAVPWNDETVRALLDEVARLRLLLDESVAARAAVIARLEEMRGRMAKLEAAANEVATEARAYAETDAGMEEALTALEKAMAEP